MSLTLVKSSIRVSSFCHTFADLADPHLATKCNFFQVWIQGAFPFKGSIGDTKSGTEQTLIQHCYKHLTWSAKHTACRQCTVQLAAALPFNKADLCADHTTLLKERSCDGFIERELLRWLSLDASATRSQAETTHAERGTHHRLQRTHFS